MTGTNGHLDKIDRINWFINNIGNRIYASNPRFNSDKEWNKWHVEGLLVENKEMAIELYYLESIKFDYEPVLFKFYETKE